MSKTVLSSPPHPIIDDIMNLPNYPNRPVIYLRLAFLFSCGLLSASVFAQDAEPTKQDNTSPPANRRPGLNDRFLDPEMNVDEWLERFEIESREVYSHRDKVLDVCEIKPGFRIADVGAGTGFYSRLFSEAAGKDGWVYSVDISARFLEHINAKAKQEEIANITTVLCTSESTCLPPNSVDLIFICDTYHHFESPQETLASIHRALKPNGTLVLIDFERIPGKSREFILGHVRAGKEVFQREIVESGLRFIDEINIPGFEENYLLRFKKIVD